MTFGCSSSTGYPWHDTSRRNPKNGVRIGEAKQPGPTYSTSSGKHKQLHRAICGLHKQVKSEPEPQAQRTFGTQTVGRPESVRDVTYQVDQESWDSETHLHMTFGDHSREEVERVAQQLVMIFPNDVWRIRGEVETVVQSVSTDNFAVSPLSSGSQKTLNNPGEYIKKEEHEREVAALKLEVEQQRLKQASMQLQLDELRSFITGGASSSTNFVALETLGVRKELGCSLLKKQHEHHTPLSPCGEELGHFSLSDNAKSTQQYDGKEQDQDGKSTHSSVDATCEQARGSQEKLKRKRTRKRRQLKSKGGPGYA